MAEHILHTIIIHYGYLGVFGLLTLGIVGIPVPDEVLLMFSGFLVSRGQMNYLGIVLAAFLGTSVGISLSFYIGHAIGLPLVHRYGKKVGITEAKIRRVEEWFHRVGKWTIFFGFFIPGFRHLTAYSAGIGNMKYKEFALYALPGGLFWSAVFITLGKQVGRHWKRVESMIHSYALWLIPVAIVFAVGSYFWFKRKSA